VTSFFESTQHRILNKI